MQKLTPNDLYTLEGYARERPAFRARVLEHKKNRIVHLGDHLTLVFEDRLTVQYQIQEMLRVERIFETDGIAVSVFPTPDGQGVVMAADALVHAIKAHLADPG